MFSLFPQLDLDKICSQIIFQCLIFNKKLTSLIPTQIKMIPLAATLTLQAFAINFIMFLRKINLLFLKFKFQTTLLCQLTFSNSAKLRHNFIKVNHRAQAAPTKEVPHQLEQEPHRRCPPCIN